MPIWPLEKAANRHAVPDCPPTDGEVAMEAQQIFYRLHNCYKRSRWLADLAGFSSSPWPIRSRPARTTRTWRLWRGNSLIKGCESRRSPGSAISASPYREKEAREGVGLKENERRFRDGNGKLTCRLEAVPERTRAEGDVYYAHGGRTCLATASRISSALPDEDPAGNCQSTTEGGEMIMIDLEHQYSRPESSGTITICGKSVELYRCNDTMMGESRFFWRADCDGRTIATLCATRKE